MWPRALDSARLLFVAFAVVASQAGCGRSDDHTLARIARAAVMAEARVASGDDPASVLRSDPLSHHYRSILERDTAYLRQVHRNLNNTRQRLGFESASVTPSDDRASVRLRAQLTLVTMSGDSDGVSEETYVVTLHRRAGDWIVTRIRNPSEFGPG
jgi:hypothetical protein